MAGKRSDSRAKRRIPHFSYATPLRHPLTDTPPEINGQTQVDNQQAAKRLKLMLEDDEDTNEGKSTEQSHAKCEASSNPPAQPVSEAPINEVASSSQIEHLYGTPTNYMSSMLAKAYRESYQRHKIDQEKFQEKEKETETEVKVDGDSEEIAEKATQEMGEQGKDQYHSKASDRGHSKGFFKPKPKVTGQRTGLGVIGQPFWSMQPEEEDQQSDDDDVRSKRIVKLLPPGPPTKVVPTMLGCDIPMPFEENPSLSPQLIDTLKKTPFPYQLDATLPPLSYQHPARVWNVVYHSLNPEKQPTVRWAFTPFTANNEVEGYLATLTVELSSSAGSQPTDTTWTGAWKQSKMEAMNEALVRALKAGMINMFCVR